jgi:hypothetical protein
VIAAVREAERVDSQPRLAHNRVPEAHSQARVTASRADLAVSALTGRKCAR